MQLAPEHLEKLPYCAGPLHAKIVFVGEAAGISEYNHPQKLPFIGKSGQLFRSWMKKVGIVPENCYITNLLKEHPPNNNFDKFINDNPSVFETHKQLLVAELAVLKNANVIVPVGARSLKFICGVDGIMNYRGSILESSLSLMLRKRKKCIPIIHPAATLLQWSTHTFTLIDLKRIKNDSQFEDFRLPQHEYIIRPTFDQVVEFLQTLLSSNEIVSVDTETAFGLLVSIQLCNNTESALCIPLQYKSGKSYWPIEQEVIIWKMLKDILYNKKLIGQYFVVFDVFVLAMHGFNPWKILKNVYLDTREAFQCYQPQLPSALEFLTSIYTRIPFYKNEGKEWSTKEGEDAFWTYGCKDVLAVKEIAPQIEKDLKKHDLWNFYQEKFLKMASLRMKLSLDGIRLDYKKRDQLRIELYQKIIKKQVELDVLIGKTINVKSHKQMSDLLYSTMKLSKQWKFEKGERRLTCNENAILKLASQNPSKVLDLILEIRHHRTETSNYVEVKTDSDHRVRSSFGFTETGRFSSSKCPNNTGYNLQNWPISMRVMLIPDERDEKDDREENIFIEMDLKQAEAMIVAYFSGDEDWINDFVTGIDIHRKTACAIFNRKICEEEMQKITFAERYTAKRINHASNYGLGYKKFCMVYNKDAIKNDVPLIDNKQSSYFLSKVHQFRPSIRNGYQKKIREIAYKNMTLENCFGRRSKFYDRWNNDLFRTLYAWYPQSTVGDLTNAIFRKIHKSIIVRNQGHDSLLCQVKRTDVKKTVDFIENASKIELNIGGRLLIIPVEFKVGKNWGEMKDYNDYKKEDYKKET